jgi:hypothetical protein
MCSCSLSTPTNDRVFSSFSFQPFVHSRLKRFLYILECKKKREEDPFSTIDHWQYITLFFFYTTLFSPNDLIVIELVIDFICSTIERASNKCTHKLNLDKNRQRLFFFILLLACVNYKKIIKTVRYIYIGVYR